MNLVSKIFSSLFFFPCKWGGTLVPMPIGFLYCHYINKASFSGRSISQAEELGRETKGDNKFGLCGLK